MSLKMAIAMQGFLFSYKGFTYAENYTRNSFFYLYRRENYTMN